MLSNIRLYKIRSELYKTIMKVFIYELQDYDFKNINITYIDLFKDLSYINIYFIIKNNKHDISSEKKILYKKLIQTRKFIRCKIAKNIHLRIIPNINFIYDESFDKCEKLNILINKASKK